MTGKRKHLILSVVALCALPAAGQAQVLLNENFDGLAQTQELGSGSVGTQFTGTHFFISGPGNSLGNFCTMPLSGNCLVLRSTDGTLTSNPVVLEPDHIYALFFDLKAPTITPLARTVDVTLGDVYNSGPITLANGAFRSVYTYITVPDVETVQLSFIASAPGQSASTNGMAVDNIGLVPEPATFGLMVLGLFGAGLAGRRRKN